MITQRTLLGPCASSYPIQDDIWAGESGQGYALRMSSDNGIGGVARIKQMLGKSRFCTLDAQDAPRIAEWFGGRVERVEFALERARDDRRVDGSSYMGHALGRSYFLNRFHPRVCPDCLREQGYCRAAWDFTLALACAVHGRLLMDRCPACSRLLDWYRPRVDICDCGYPWLTVDSPSEPTSWELTLARCIDDRLEDGHQTGSLGSLGSPSLPGVVEGGADEGLEYQLASLMSGMSLDGVLRMIHALATAHGYTSEAAEEKRVRGAMDKARQTAEWARSMGLRLVRGETVALSRRPSVLLDLLGEVAASRAIRSTDASLAQSLLEMLLTRSSASRWTARHSSLAQMALF